MSNFQFTRVERFPPIVKNLIIINILVFVAQIVFDNQIQLTQKLSLWPVKSDEFKPYQIATHMFAHIGFVHLLFNMLGLWMFGRVLENVWGGKRFLFFYLACGVGATILSLGIDYFRYDQIIHDAEVAFANNDKETAIRIIRQLGYSLGASGAVLGVLAGFGYLFPNTEMMIVPIPVPVKAKWLILGIVAIDLFSGIANTGKENVGHFAHLGGALTGFIIVLIWNKTNRRTLY
jgi:membrane associated rhomboid family serine protease